MRNTQLALFFLFFFFFQIFLLPADSPTEGLHHLVLVATCGACYHNTIIYSGGSNKKLRTGTNAFLLKFS